MNYTKFQKIISSIVLFWFFFTFIFRFPSINIFSNVFADNKKFFNIVSIIVDENIYNDIQGEVKRYATDIQNNLENTKVIILPTPKNVSAFDIASLNENLYFEWYNWLNKADFTSKLIWTVLVWDLPLPIINDWNKNSKTILPYVDFEDKKYVYNKKNKKYELWNSNLDWFKPEIWHWVISPNTWNKATDIKQIKDYFEKNHSFYVWTWNFQTSNWIINWKKWDELNSNYEPYVFYFDQFRTSQSLVYNSYKSYEWYLDNREDLVYNRFSKDLAKKLKDKVLWKNNEDLSSLIKNVDPNFDLSKYSWNLSAENITDIQSRYIIQNSIKKFVQAFNWPSLWKITENVHNAWRYNWSWSKVNVDMIPSLVSVLDWVSDEVIKSVNNDLEKYIDDLVIKWWLSRKIAIPTTIILNNGCDLTYTNFLYWKQTKDITNASECSIYLWSSTNSWKVVEANRWLNLRLTQSDAFCNWATSWYWWGNSPLNIDISNISNLTLKNHDLKSWIVPLFDIAWSKEIKDNSKILSPLNCLENNLILTNKNEYSNTKGCYVSYNVPINWTSPINWNCSTNNSKYSNNFNFESIYQNLPSNSCLNLDGVKITWNCVNQYNFKTIGSYITHKSPTSDELKKQVNSLETPNLPLDKDRYIDFIWANWNYAKINYPYLFRILSDVNRELSIESISSSIKSTLDSKTLEINSLIKSLDPSSISWVNKEIYEKLKISNYPNDNVDLYNYLKSKPISKYSLSWEEKDLSYYDTLSFAIYWNSLPSIWAKYKFIFENYLSDEFGWNNLNIHLPKNKKSYEIAYLWAEWDSNNMYIKLEPEDKWENPYSDIITKNKELSTFLMASKIQDWDYTKSSDKCWPPEWVPIWQWMWTISCWMRDLLPPTVWVYNNSKSNDLLTSKEKEELLSCSWDDNKNWIDDCIESKFVGWKLELNSESQVYSYNKIWNLKASIKDKDWNILKFDNNTKIHFELSKIEIPKNSDKEFTKINTKTIYNKEKRYEWDNIEVKKYLSFTDIDILSKSWEAINTFSTKNKNSNLYFNASLEIKDNKWKTKIFLNSWDISLQVRWWKLFLESNKIIKENWVLNLENSNNSLLASDKTSIFLVDSFKKSLNEIKDVINDNSSSKEKLILSLSNIDENKKNKIINYPLIIRLFNVVWEQIWDNININSEELNTFKPLFSIKKSWTYKVEITDSLWYKIDKNIDIIPEKPNKLDVKLWTSITQAWWTITTHLVSILDVFWNIVSWDLYNLDLSIIWDWVSFDNIDPKKVSFETYEWYKVFRLKSTNIEWINNINFKLKDLSWNLILEKNSQIRTYKNIILKLQQNQPQIKVWWWVYDFDLTLTDEYWKILNWFNSRAYININKIYWEVIWDFFDIKDWKAKISLKTTSVSWEKIPLEIQIEWLIGINKRLINIFPDIPMKIDMNLSKSKMEASVNESSILEVELKDRYWNLVFNDNGTNFNLDIEWNYNKIISSNNKTQVSNWWKAIFKIFWKENPWTAYFKISTNPSISNNKLEVWDLSINWVSENVWKIETFYFWNKDKIIWRKYNSIYTALLWASYWDITKENYLAWSLLFDKDNRSLAITSLLNDPFNYNDVININPNWAIWTISQWSDLSQNIDYNINFSNNKLYLDLFNESTNSYIWKILYNLGSNLELKSCIWKNNDFSDCNFSDKNNSVLLKSLNKDYWAYMNDWKLVFKTSFWKNLLEISDNWEIKKLWNINFELDKKNPSNYLILKIKSWNSYIWLLAVNLVNSNINVSRNEAIFNNNINTLKNNILVYIKSNSYNSRDIYTDNKNSSKSIYYNDPFSYSKKATSDYFSKWTDSIENFSSQDWIGWNSWNKFLLSFSAWDSVWDSTKNYQSFSLINLWDPVISLKPIKKKFPNTNDTKSFDSTIWKKISNDKDIFGYRTFDYNNDKREDILLIKNNWYLKLLENKNVENNFIDKWNLAFISDLWDKNLVLAWDFNWDWFWDIFFVNDKQKPWLLNNFWKEFKRIDIENNIKVDWKIIQAKSFDMDNDDIEDIVILDDEGWIYIFYGSKTWLFTKNKLTNTHKISLNSEVRNDGWLVYFDWIYQFPQTMDRWTLIKENESLFSLFPANFSKSSSSDSLAWENKNLMSLYNWSLNDISNKISPFLNEAVLRNSVFEEVLYDRWNKNNKSVSVFSRIPDYTSVSPQTLEIAKSVNKAKADFEQLVEDYPEYVTWSIDSNYTQTTNFVKSEYSHNLWLEVEKRYIPNNWSSFKAWENIDVEVILKNTSWKTLKDIAYLENIPNIFTFDSSSINTSIYTNIQINKVAWYNFLIDWFSIPDNWNIKITYKIKVLPIKYWDLKVWLFESWEIGDDNFWDIILKTNNSDKSNKYLIYRSSSSVKYSKSKELLTSTEDINNLTNWVRNNKNIYDKKLLALGWESRNYELWTKILTPDSNKIKLPDSISKNLIDENKNWTPDYIDEIKSNKTSFQNYSQNTLNQFNKDWDNDWIPDNEDDSPSFNSENWWIMWALNSINDSVDKISEWVDNIISSLCNWFWWCFSLPVNWAPLASWSDPSIFGFPVWDWLKVEEWLPVFSTMTWLPTWVPPFCIPSVWPVSPLWVWCSVPSAWWRLWTWDPTNYFRLFITPTITWAIWFEACFGWPASVVWRTPPPWVSPTVPWWNCIVKAVPLPLCSDDWSDWDVASTWLPQSSSKKSNNKYDVINSNSSKKENKKWLLDKVIAWEYLKSKQNKNYKPNYPKNISSQNFIFSWQRKSLVNMDWWWEWSMELSVDIDKQAFVDWNYTDVIKIKMDRVWAFPDFLMNWVNRQIEEIANKLTDFPTLFVILPDFSWAFNWLSWEVDDFMWKIDDIQNKFEDKEQQADQKIQKQIDSESQKRQWSDCSWMEGSVNCFVSDAKIQKLNLEKNISPTVTSWIQSVYELLSNLPVITIKTEIVNINVPWVDLNTVNKTIFNREMTVKQREQEINKATDSWSLWTTCKSWDIGCKEANDASQKVLVDARWALSTIKKNIDTLKSIKNFPKDLNKMLNMKEIRLWQIVSNVETISEITWWWIWRNWKTFKSWVELYVLVKAILESWQLLIDIFNDYQAECIACKNERYTLMYFIFKLISMIIPDIPVIQFPKWPDVIIDIHNIRIWLEVYIPEFNFSKRPIVLPNLPALYLPDSPNIWVKLPQLPLLPSLKLPTLPDLPTLPSINLPNLPKPPKLPKILWAFNWILKILKLVVKIMCILRSNPFVPEWRAWDQIAFITSRTWFMPLDFIDLSLPQFSLPFVDAIEIKSFLNLEFWSDFITEMVRSWVEPLWSFTNDVTNMTKIWIPNVDLRNNVPSDVNINIKQDWTINPSVWIDTKQLIKIFAFWLSKKINNMIYYIDENKDIKVDNKDFISIVNLALSSKEVANNPKTEKLRNLWTEVWNLTYEKENKKISELLKNNEEKFQTVKNILNTEIEQTKSQRKVLEKKLFKDEWIFKNVSSEYDIKAKISIYNEKLRPYNYNLAKSITNFKNSWNKERNELKAKWKQILETVNSWINNLNKELLKNEESKNNILAINSNSTNNTSSSNQDSSDYWYNYEWLYVLENDKSYRLIDYSSELNGDEQTTIIDNDLDNDDDLLYMVNNELFLKENLDKNPINKEYLTDSPIIVSSKNNKFFNQDKYIEAVNYFREWKVSNWNINLIFDSSTDENINNYRVEIYKIVDKFDNEWLGTYIPKNITKLIIDSFSNVENSTISSQNENYTLRNNLAYINDIWSTVWLKLTTKSLVNIKKDISNNVIVNLLAWTYLYAWWENFKINYYEEWNEDNLKSITVLKYQNIEFSKNIKIVWINWDAYLEWDSDIVLNDQLIRTYYKKPLLLWAKLEVVGKNISFNEKSHINIMYYDNSELWIDFRKINNYTLYDLWEKSSDYRITIPKENGYDYAKIMSFKNNIYSTKSNQELVSPQIEADKNPPELTLTSKIKIPVYQKKIVDLTPYLYEDSWLINIRNINIDFNLDIDSDKDWDPTNDKDSAWAVLQRTSKSVKIDFWAFSKLENKKIWITLKDANGNVWYREIPFEVYSPIPKIEAYLNQKVVWNIWEKLNNQPVDLYRNRDWNIEKLSSESLTNSWSFSFTTEKTSTWLVLSHSGSVLSFIDENTWKITLKEDSSNSKIKIDSKWEYPEFIFSYKWKNIYSQFIKFIKNLPITIVEDFNSINPEKEWLYIKINNKDKYNSYIIPKWVPYNPWTFVIYKEWNSNIPLVSIFQDARINLKSSIYYLDYETFWNLVVLNLKEKVWNKSIAQILYNINASYIVK